jgi:hypothetical protein
MGLLHLKVLATLRQGKRGRSKKGSSDEGGSSPDRKRTVMVRIIPFEGNKMPRTGTRDALRVVLYTGYFWICPRDGVKQSRGSTGGEALSWCGRFAETLGLHFVITWCRCTVGDTERIHLFDLTNDTGRHYVWVRGRYHIDAEPGTQRLNLVVVKESLACENVTRRITDRRDDTYIGHELAVVRFGPAPGSTRLAIDELRRIHRSLKDMDINGIRVSVIGEGPRRKMHDVVLSLLVDMLVGEHALG